jgi:hypothetical protein
METFTDLLLKVSLLLKLSVAWFLWFMISTNQLELFSTVPTTVPTTVLYWFLGADGPRTKLLKLTESFSNSETFSNKSVNVSNDKRGKLLL